MNSKKKAVLISTDAQSKQHQILAKVLGGICDLHAEEIAEINSLNLDERFPDAEYFFLVFDVLKYETHNITTEKNAIYCLPKSVPFSEYQASVREAKLPKKTSFLDLNAVPATDLLRFINGFINAEKTPGLSHLYSKETEIVFEKIQSLGDIGLSADALYQKVCIATNSFHSKMFEVQTIFTSLVSQSFEFAKSNTPDFPTCSIQMAYDKNRVCFTTRFSIALADPQAFVHKIKSGQYARLQQIWLNSDLTQITYYSSLNEIEIKTALYANSTQRDNLSSILVSTTEDNIALPNLAIPPEEYQYFLLNDIIEAYFESIQDRPSDTALGTQFLKQRDQKTALQKVLAQKSQLLNKVTSEFESQGEKVQQLVQSDQTKILGMQKEISDFQEEVARLNKALEIEKRKTGDANALGKNTEDLEKERDALQSENKILKERIANSEEKAQAADEKAKDKHKSAVNSDKTISELERKVQELEEEKTRLEKRSTDQAEKLKKLAEAKSEEKPKPTAAPVGASAEDIKRMRSRLFEMEENEKKMTQALKQLQFKLEAADKAVAMAKKEQEESKKLLEKKLDFEKKKSEELGARLIEMEKALKAAKRAA